MINPYNPMNPGQPSYGTANLGFGSQSSNPYAQMYANWVNQQMAPYMGQQQQIAPNQLAQLQAQIAALQNQMAPMQNDMLSSQWRSGGNP